MSKEFLVDLVVPKNRRNDYFYLFQICGLILLVAMIGSITLTLRDRGQIKRQKISSQNYVDAKKAIEKKKVKIGEGL